MGMPVNPTIPPTPGGTTLEGPRSVATDASENLLTRFGQGAPHRKRRKPSSRERSFRGYRSAMASAKTPEANAAGVRSGLKNIDLG